MTESADFSMPQPGEDSHRFDGGQPSGTLQAALHATLSRQIPDLVVRWTAESRETLLLTASRSDEERESMRDSDVASDLVRTLIAALAVDDDEESNAIAAGLRFGAESFASGSSLHHTARAVGLLVAMALNAMERAAAGDDVPSGNVADGVWHDGFRIAQHCSLWRSLELTRRRAKSRCAIVSDIFAMICEIRLVRSRVSWR